MIIAEADVRMFSTIASSSTLHFCPHSVMDSVAATAAANSRAIWLPPAIASAPKHLMTNANVITNTTRGMAAIQRGVCALYLKKKLEKFIYVTN